MELPKVHERPQVLLRERHCSRWSYRVTGDNLPRRC